MPSARMAAIVGMTWMEYAPKRDVLYIMKMGSELYKMPRK